MSKLTEQISDIMLGLTVDQFGCIENQTDIEEEIAELVRTWDEKDGNQKPKEGSFLWAWGMMEQGKTMEQGLFDYRILEGGNRLGFRQSSLPGSHWVVASMTTKLVNATDWRVVGDIPENYRRWSDDSVN